MQKTIILFIFLTIFSFGYSSVLHAQEIRTNAQGQEIMVYPDGTWKFLEDVEDELAPSGNNANQIDDDNLDGKQSRLAAIKRADEAFRLASRAEEEYQSAKLNKILIEEELDDLDELEDEAEWSRINELYTAAKAKYKAAKKSFNEAKEYAELMDKMIYMSDKKRNRMLAKLDKKTNHREPFEEEFDDDEVESNFETASSSFDDESTPNPSSDFMEFEEDEVQTEDTPKTQQRQFAKYDITKDVFFSPPQPDCQYDFIGIDEFSKKQRTDVAKQLFFSYTTDQMRQYLQGREYITCYGHMTKVSGGLRFLTLSFHIASNLAPQSFGNLPKGSILSIQLLDGDIINVRNTKDDPGYFDQHENAYIYRGVYPLGGKMLKTLKNAEIDKVRVVWGTGYEDYEIYEMDFFKNQLGCLEK